MRRILVPTDFSENALTAVRYAAALAAATGAELVLAHVAILPVLQGNAPHGAALEALEQEKQLAWEQLQQQAQQLQQQTSQQGQQLQVVCRLVADTFVAGMQQLTAAEQCHLIVMGTKGASGLRRLFMGSNTTDLMEHTRVPLIAVPQQYQFSGMSRIVFALEADKPGILSPHLNVIRELAEEFSSEILVLTVLKSGQKIPPPEMHTGHVLKERMGQVPLFYLTITGEEPLAAITDYAARNRPDLVVLHPQRRTVWQLLFEKRVSREMVFGPEVPVMTMPLPAEE